MPPFLTSFVFDIEEKKSIYDVGAFISRFPLLQVIGSKLRELAERIWNETRFSNVGSLKVLIAHKNEEMQKPTNSVRNITFVELKSATTAMIPCFEALFSKKTPPVCTPGHRPKAYLFLITSSRKISIIHSV
jgi:hypothetical protein